MKNWSQFYTPPKLANLLIDTIDENFDPKNVIDICAGSCNLLRSASNRWPNALFFGSDIEKISNNLIPINNLTIKNLNAVDTKKVIRLYKKKEKKLVLANPPFGYFHSMEKLHHPHSLNDISESIKGINRIECLITISNLSILNKGDYFAAILPENMFSGATLRKFKYHLCKIFTNMTIEKHTINFKNSEVRTRILSGKYIGERNFLSQTNKIEYSASKKKKNYQILRGIDNSTLKNEPINSSHIRVLHFNNLKGNVEKLKTVEYASKYDEKIINETDILIFRVGRNAGKILFPDERHFGCPPSDLILILKNCKSLGKKKLKCLEKELEKKVKGLTLKYICKQDVVDALENAK